MKKTLIIAGILGAFAATANAQSSVTLYGTLDAGLIYSNNVGGNSLYKLGSGSVSGTNFGLRGIEDLGHGTSVLFKIEAGFDSNDGAQAESGTLFNRASYVGVQNNQLGTLTLGRQYDSAVDYLAPLAAGSLGNGNNFAAHPFDNDNLSSSFSVENSIKYTSANYAGLQFGGLYGFSNEAGGFADNRAWSI